MASGIAKIHTNPIAMALLASKIIASKMTRKTTKRKHWNLVNPIGHAIHGCRITPDAALDRLRLRELASLEVMSKGRGTIQEWRDLADVCNLAETMGKSGIGPEALPDCQRLQEDLIRAAQRYESTRAMGLTAQGIQAAREVIEWHDLQRRSVARSVYESMIKRTANRIRSGAPEVVAI